MRWDAAPPRSYRPWRRRYALLPRRIENRWVWFEWFWRRKDWVAFNYFEITRRFDGPDPN